MPETIPRFNQAIERGEVVDRSGYHQPGESFHGRGCGCSLTTSKGAYRDVSVELPDGRVVHFYHQSPVVVESSDGTELHVSSCGYKTATTKERINRHLPRDYYVRQVDYEWILETPNGEEPWSDGTVIERHD